MFFSPYAVYVCCVLISIIFDTLFVCLLVLLLFILVFFFFKQKPSYEMRISDWSSDVCSSDLDEALAPGHLDDDVGAQPSAIAIDDADLGLEKIGRASWRERVCQYV